MAQVRKRQWRTASSQNKCDSPYVPKRLKWRNRPIRKWFNRGERLYWRLPAKLDINMPFSTISLFDISFNRSGKWSRISNKSDVLIQPHMAEKLNLGIITLTVKHFSEHPRFRMKVIDDRCNETVDMCLIHDPLLCNYSHSMIIFEMNGKLRVTKANYKETFDLDTNKSLKYLRKSCKDEIGKMIISRQVALPY